MLTHHATAFLLGDRGVLLRGPSGAGKTGLALALIEAQRAAGGFACLVADDRVVLDARGGRLVCRVPEPIAGLAEIRGFGPTPLGFEPGAAVDLVVDLVEPGEAPRYAPDGTVDLIGCRLAHLRLDRRDQAGAGRAIRARLASPAFP